MFKKKMIILCIFIFVIFIGVLTIVGFVRLDRTLAEQTAVTWNKIYENSSVMKETETGDFEERIIRSGAKGNNLCTFACNVDWGEEIIPEMLKILDEEGVKITFFVSGRWAENNPELLKEMYEKGHEIQSHGYSHALCSQVSEEKVRTEIEETEKAIIDAISIKPNYFAPPAGDYDEKTVKIAEELGYRVLLWSSDTIDWREDSTAEVIVERIMSKPLDGAIVLMHPKEETAKALPSLINGIKTQGYNIVPLYRMPL